MPKYVIERETPGAGKAAVEQLRESAANSNQVIADLRAGDPLVRELHHRRQDVLRLRRIG